MAESNFGFDQANNTSGFGDTDEEAGILIRDFNHLERKRGNWNNHWGEIAERVLPMHANLFRSLGMENVEGQKVNMEIFDSTGVIALQRFGSILDSLLTPRNQYWHQIRPSDPGLLKDKQTRVWFEETNQKLFEYRYSPRANFASQNQNVYQSLGAYGTAALFIDDLAGHKGVRYRNVHLSELYLQENHQGIVDSVARKFSLTVRQAVQKFGDSLPKDLRDMEASSPNKHVWFIHWVRPNGNRDALRKDHKGMEFESFYVSITGQKIVARGGYRSFPYAVSRYTQTPMEAYGRSPAMDVLPSIKTLNEQKKTMLKQGHRIVDPVLLAHDDGVIDAFSMMPGAINPGGVTKDGRLLIQPLPVGNVQAGKDFMEEERNLIKDTFLVSIFQILTENPTMTATEVMERTREKGILLAPTIGRQQSEYLGPMIDREIDILNRQGLLSPMPKMLRSAKGEYKMEYDSPITRSQKAEVVAGAQRALEFFGQYASQTQDPSVLDVFDIDVAGPEVALAYGMPASWVRAPEDIAKIRQQRAQQQQMQTAIQAAPAAAGMMKAQQGQSGGGQG